MRPKWRWGNVLLGESWSKWYAICNRAGFEGVCRKGWTLLAD